MLQLARCDVNRRLGVLFTGLVGCQINFLHLWTRTGRGGEESVKVYDQIISHWRGNFTSKELYDEEIRKKVSAINRKICGIDDVHFRPLTKSKSAAIHTSHVTVTSINILSTDVKIIQPLSIHFDFQCNMQINNSHKSSPPGGTCQLKPKSFVLRTNSKRRTVSTFFLFYVLCGCFCHSPFWKMTTTACQNVNRPVAQRSRRVVSNCHHQRFLLLPFFAPAVGHMLHEATGTDPPTATPPMYWTPTGPPCVTLTHTRVDLLNLSKIPFPQFRCWPVLFNWRWLD